MQEAVYLIFVLKQLIQKRSIDINIYMQLNNLVIIPVPYQSIYPLVCPEPYRLSPCKSLSRTNSQRDDITWKKSISAFKKFKGKKDKEVKSIRNSLTHIPLLQQNDQDHLLRKNFFLASNNINFGLLNIPYDEIYKLEQMFDYFDPNHAPFFQFGVSYQYLPKQSRVQVIEEQQHFNQLIQLKKTQSVRLKKQISKKQKFRQQNSQKDNLVRTQKGCSSEGILPQQILSYSDPFIIIKARQRRGEIGDSVIMRVERSKKEEIKKNKMIKKNFKHSSRASNSSAYSRSVYSNPNSDQLRKQGHDSQSDEKSNDYGNDELPIIQFDLFKHINPVNHEMDKQQNGLEQLPIYELKDNSHAISKIKQYQNSTEILQQYDFNEEQQVPQNHN